MYNQRMYNRGNQSGEIASKLRELEEAMDNKDYKRIYNIINSISRLEKQRVENHQIRKIYNEIIKIKSVSDKNRIEKILIKSKLLIEYAKKRDVINESIARILERPIDWALKNTNDIDKIKEVLLDTFQMMIVHLTKK